MTTYIGVADAHWRWTGKKPGIHRSSPGVERTFCADCGSPISFRSQAMSGVMHFFVALMADPGQFEPQCHVAWEERLPWLPVADDLPKFEGPSYLGKVRPLNQS